MTPTLTVEETQQRDGFVERMLDSVRGLFDTFAIYLGDQMGFYQALADHGPATSVELARRTHANERYVREWLEQQTIYGILEVDNPAASPTERSFRLPSAHAEVLTDRESLNYLAPLSQLAVSVTRPLDSLLKVYKQGGGVPYADYGRDLRVGQGNMNRTMFLQQLGAEWLPTIPDVHTRLQANPPALIADIGCGLGWSSIGMAQSYPNARVDGFDLDGPSIEMARDNAMDYHLNGRLTFHERDAGDPSLIGRYDLVTAFECVHDMGNPVGALRTMRRLAGERGAVIVVDERVGDIFTPQGNEVEWMMYGWSLLHCLPVGMAEEPSAATGTVMRTETLRQYAKEAGFCEVEVLPIDNFFFRFYRLWL
jgi:SAM-dependent methyltransferase